MHWKPIRLEELRVGHYIRIGHRWFDHPFAVNTFTISSMSEIAILRDANLNRLFVDLNRSRPAPMDTAPPAPESPGTMQHAQALHADIQADSARLSSQKQQQVNGVRLQRAQLQEVAVRYQAAAKDSGLALAMLSAGYPQAGPHCHRLLEALLRPGEGSENPLTLAHSQGPVDVQQLHALQSLDTVAIAAVVARRLALSAEQSRLLCLAAMLHLVGLQRVPASQRHEMRLTSVSDIQAFRSYPSLGAELLRECPDLPREVAELVAQHRERRDGSGFPNRLGGADIPPLALYVGVIHEFVALTTRDAPLTPTAALAYLFRTRRAAFGDEVVEAFVAALTVYPPGSFVSLTDGSIARVVRVSQRERMRPTVLIYDPALSPGEAEILDLSATRSVGVHSPLDPRQLMSGILDFFGGRDWSGLALSGAPAAVPLAA